MVRNRTAFWSLVLNWSKFLCNLFTALKIDINLLCQLTNLRKLERVEVIGNSLITTLTKLTSLKFISLDPLNFCLTSLKQLQKLAPLTFDVNFSQQLRFLTQLTYLDLSFCALNPDIYTSLRELTQLRFLSFHFSGFNGLEDEGLVSMAHLTNLTLLDCYFCPKLTNNGLIRLTTLVNLKYAEFGHCKFTSHSMNPILRKLTNLEHIGLPLQIDDSSIFMLTRLQKSLSSINLWNLPHVSSRSLKILSTFTSLTSLSCYGLTLNASTVLSFTTLTQLRYLRMELTNQNEVALKLFDSLTQFSNSTGFAREI